MYHLKYAYINTRSVFLFIRDNLEVHCLQAKLDYLKIYFMLFIGGYFSMFIQLIISCLLRVIYFYNSFSNSSNIF